MTNFFKYKKLILFLVLVISIASLLAYLVNFKILKIRTYNDINIYIKPVNPLIKTICADSSNRLVLKVETRDKHGNPISGVPVKFSSYNNVGIFYPESNKTNEFGEALVSYIPPDTIDTDTIDIKKDMASAEKTNINLAVEVMYKKEINASISFKLIPVPVVFVHGYQSTGDIFKNMADYINSAGFESIFINYNSSKGAVSSSNELRDFLIKQKSDYISKGIQVSKFDMICHSMGGIVTRYYTSSKEYIEYNNVRKMIFISVPHKGSHLAPIGAKYFEDQGVKDMMPDSSLFVDIFPSMNNGGLNPTIQVGNILGQYDEVVTSESGMLNEWNIDTQIFNLGASNFSIDNFSYFSDVDISRFAIHRVILNNKKVFEKIVEMLKKKLQYPVLRESKFT